MPPKRKAAPKKKAESPPQSESEAEQSPEPEVPKAKKSKPSPKPKAPPKVKAAFPKPVVASPSRQKPKAGAKPKKGAVAKRGGKLVVTKSIPSPSPVKKSAPKPVIKRVVIEHCKQCSSFKRIAGKLVDLLKEAVPDLEVTMNPEKPRKGIFQVRDENGTIFVSLEDMRRPFKPMKDLDLEETATAVVAKLK